MSGAIFISYRRQDTAPIARNLREELQRSFKNPIFLDTEEIGTGDVWAAEIRNALDSAVLLIVVIGPNWLRNYDEHGRRRIDNREDWINIEIRECLAKGIPIIPLVVNNGQMPVREGLPEEIKNITNFQNFLLRDEHWARDLSALFDKLRREPFRFEQAEDALPLPVLISTPKCLPGALTDTEIQQELLALADWKLSTSPMPGQYPKHRVEIFKQYKFNKFSDAVAFMGACVPIINKKQHHPRWQTYFGQ
jgi:pterin-4a-carbinolamine dehydratase